jgi:nucleoid DNA-binding protein
VQRTGRVILPGKQGKNIASIIDIRSGQHFTDAPPGWVSPAETGKCVSEWSSTERIIAPKEFKMTEVVKKAKSKTEIVNALAEGTGLSKKDIANVFAQLSDLIGKEIGKKGPGVFSVPGLMKITVVRKPATKAMTKPNPFKPGEMMLQKAKPARSVVKIRALKALKDLA